MKKENYEKARVKLRNSRTKQTQIFSQKLGWDNIENNLEKLSRRRMASWITFNNKNKYKIRNI